MKQYHIRLGMEKVVNKILYILYTAGGKFLQQRNNIYT